MVPGVPNDDEITANANKPSSSRSLGNTHVPYNSGSGPLTSLQDKWDDIREAVMETDTYAFVMERAESVKNVTMSIWGTAKRCAWVLGTSGLVLVVPLLYEIDKELGPGADPSSINSQTSSSSSSSAPSDGSSSTAS